MLSLNFINNPFTFILSGINFIVTCSRKGFYDLESNSGKRTRLWATEKFISSLLEHRKEPQIIDLLNYKRPIILKDENKNLIKYNPSGRIISRVRFLNKYNEFIDGCEILFPVNVQVLNNLNTSMYPLSNEYFINIYHSTLTQLILSSTCTITCRIPLLVTLEPKLLFNKELQGQLFRVFNNGKFTRGGRFYGGSFQQLNEKDRAKITINGSPVIEVDYSAYHLNMLYHLTNKQFDNDPYTRVLDIPEARPILKLVCLIAINSQNKSQALKALRKEIRKNPALEKLKRIYQLDETQLLRKFESVHFKISNYFYNNIGIRLQFLDSEITESILKYFTSREIPCLAVHDSFLVPGKYEDELKAVMRGTYKSKFKYDIKVK